MARCITRRDRLRANVKSIEELINEEKVKESLYESTPQVEAQQRAKQFANHSLSYRKRNCRVLHG